MARPKKNTVDYFPHDCNRSKHLKIIESKYGNDGYAFFYKLREELGKSENHIISCSTSLDVEYLASETGVSKDKMISMVTTMTDINYLDKEIWTKDQTIWCGEFVESLSEVYKKRSNDIPKKGNVVEDKNSFRPENPSFRPGNPQSKVKKSKEKKSIVNKAESSALLSIQEYQKKFPKKDIEASMERFLQFKKIQTHENAMEWFENEKREKPVLFRKAASKRYYIAYCSKCGNKEMPNDEWAIKKGSDCCKVEYLTEKPDHVVSVKRKTSQSSKKDQLFSKEMLQELVHE
jgi:hypothetical protein